jgi:hypothetical protein
MYTVSDLLSYAKQQARIEAIDYFNPSCTTPQEVRAWKQDRYRRDADRRRVFRKFGARIAANDPLIPGSYGPSRRLTILPNGKPEYTAGQYCPTEIWSAIYFYFEGINA